MRLPSSRHCVRTVLAAQRFTRGVSIKDVGLCGVPCYPHTNQIAALSAARSLHDVGAQAFDSHSDLSEDEPDSNTVYVGGRYGAIRRLPYCEPLSIGMPILHTALSHLVRICRWIECSSAFVLKCATLSNTSRAHPRSLPPTHPHAHAHVCSGAGSVADANEPEVIRLGRHAERLRRTVARLKRQQLVDEEAWRARLADAVAIVRQEGHERLNRAMKVRAAVL